MRTATLKRETRETQIEVTVTLDGKGKANIDTGIGFNVDYSVPNYLITFVYVFFSTIL